jgi:predicted AlkP superfamily phosphohydrolase/phosphomutase
MSSRSRIFVIGIDGGTWEVLKPRLDKGLMPNLKKLMDAGTWGTLLSTIPPFTIPAWASFFTGTNPGKHGVQGFFEVEADDYESRGENGLVNSRSITGIPIWEHLSRNDIRAGFVNVPLTYPVSEIKGFMISGMLTPPGSKNFTFPKTLADFLDDYVIDIGYLDKGDDLSSKYDRGNKTKLLDEILFMHERRTANCVRLLKIFPDLDFFMVVFTSFDRICHSFWEHLQGQEIGSSGKRPAREQAIREKIESYFSALDESIGRLLEFRDDRTLCFIISDHGFGPAPTKEVYLNNWLLEKGFLQMRSDLKNIADIRYWLAKTGFNKELAKKWLGRLPLGRLSYKLQKSIKGRQSLIEWRKTLAYTTPMYTNTCGITINTRGLKPQGIVEMGEGYEKLRDRLIRELSTFENPENAERVVEHVYRREEIYRGSHLRNWPDLIVIFNKDYSVTQQIGNSVFKRRDSTRRSGDHIREGIFVAAGDSIRNGQLEQPVNIVDLLPTYLHIYGLPLLPDLDGRIIRELFTDKFAEFHRERRD